MIVFTILFMKKVILTTKFTFVTFLEITFPPSYSFTDQVFLVFSIHVKVVKWGLRLVLRLCGYAVEQMIFHMSHNCGLFDHDELPQKRDKKSIEKNLFHKHYIYDLFDIERMCLFNTPDWVNDFPHGSHLWLFLQFPLLDKRIFHMSHICVLLDHYELIKMAFRIFWSR